MPTPLSRVLSAWYWEARNGSAHLIKGCRWIGPVRERWIGPSQQEYQRCCYRNMLIELTSPLHLRPQGLGDYYLAYPENNAQPTPVIVKFFPTPSERDAWMTCKRNGGDVILGYGLASTTHWKGLFDYLRYLPEDLQPDPSSLLEPPYCPVLMFPCPRF